MLEGPISEVKLCGTATAGVYSPRVPTDNVAMPCNSMVELVGRAVTKNEVLPVDMGKVATPGTTIAEEEMFVVATAERSTPGAPALKVAMPGIPIVDVAVRGATTAIAPSLREPTVKLRMLFYTTG